jgi:membrane protein implicated in regulation of membrane protease activity
MQHLRLRRFGISVSTYAVVILATVLITCLGLGEMSGTQWATYIGLSLFGNNLFFVLFCTNANLRFSEPSLTREQIVYSAFWGTFALYWLPEARPIILMFYLAPFTFGMLSLTLRQYLSVVVCVMGLYAALLGLEYFQDHQGFNIQYQLFLFVLLGILLTWFAFFGGFVSSIRRRLQKQKEEIKKSHEEIKIEMEERKNIQIEKDKLIVELEDALSKVKTLSGFLPICASCKKIRDDNGYWNQIEAYIQTHSDAEFSHGICPECAKKLYPDFYSCDENK